MEIFSRVLSKVLGKRVLKKLHLKSREIRKKFKTYFYFIYSSYLNKSLNRSTKKLINSLYVKYIFNILTNLYNKIYSISDYKLLIHHFFFKNKLENVKLKKCKIRSCGYKKKKNEAIKNIKSKHLEDKHGLESNEHYIIDLYDETHLKNDISNSLLFNNRSFSFESDCITTLYSDSSKFNINDRLNSNSYLENDTLSFENIEYDEDEANESIKNCYLYNGYINATTYKKSDEYKFLKCNFKKKVNSSINIEIDILSDYCDEKTENESENEQQKIYQQKKKKKKKIYEIYNTETTKKQNIYCANYLNENYDSSSYDFTSEESNSVESDFSDKDFRSNYSEDICGNYFLCY